MSKMKKLRKRIDKIDNNILRFLNERAKITLEIGSLKSRRAAPEFSPAREAEVYRRLLELNRGPLLNHSIKAVYREIMSGALALQKKLKIAYLGPEATFTHIAAMEKFGKSLNYHQCDSIAEVFTEVEREKADYGVVPIENSTEGAVNHTLDMFIDSDLQICSESYVRINHNLLGLAHKPKNEKLANIIKRVYSHQQVIAQCRVWLEKNLPSVQLVEVASTTLAAANARFLKDPGLKGSPRNTAAIASSLAAEKYNLNILESSIEDSPHNITRFLIIGKQKVEATGNDKTSIVFSMKDRVGALHDVLVPFKRNKINLTKIESRPSKKKAWKYYFFVDMEGHIQNKQIKQVLRQLKKACTYYKELGSYPASR